MTRAVAEATLQAMVNLPRPAEELAVLDRELARIEARRAQLLARRSYLLTLLTAVAPPVPPTPRAGPAARAPETSPPSVQNALLALGGVLLTVAAIAFTVVSWGAMGIGGRSLVLGTVTVAALGAPVLLLRRSLVSTAEAVGALALVLTVLDAYALYRVALPDADPLGYSAAVCAVLAALWATYGLLVDRLRTPLPAAVLTAQLPLPLWALATGAGQLTLAWALLATAAADAALVLWTGPTPARSIAGVTAWVTGGWALLTAVALSLSAGSPPDAVPPGALLLAGAGLGLLVAVRVPDVAFAGGLVASLSAIAATGGVPRPSLPLGWAVVGYLLCGAALLTAVRSPLPRAAVRGLGAAAGAVVAGAALWALPPAALALLGPASRAEAIWSGAPGGARQALGTDPGWPALTTAPLVLLIAAALLAAAHRRLPESARPAALGGATALGWAAGLVLPAALDFGYAAAVTTHLALTAGALTLAVYTRLPVALRRPHPAAPPVLPATAMICALAGAGSVALLALADETTTLITLGVLLALLGGGAVALNPAASEAGTGAGAAHAAFSARAFQALLGCLSVATATALLCAFCASAGLPRAHIALAVLAVPAAVAPLGARLRHHPVSLPIELTSAGAGLLAVVLAAGRPGTTALVLALCAVIAAGTALRPDRRPAAGHLATVLFVLATWVRLYASDVSTPEAYTLPVTVPALVVGVLRRRRAPEASSWTAYGPGLAATLLPSLAAAWGDTHWVRPLALGVAALAVTLVGARLGLRAPLVLGGAVLALDTLHELAPYVVQVVDSLPRWLPPALAGLLLLALGATYERRLHDARRLRRTLGRMR
ncbi:SCO7613 C-terminal domain-containing membrane protein [Streptomyces sp. NPDC058653]|uniref:SCO7613 C-terminal domain-containing membrane protein n=1 Tax=Streptomyces sp. NPDC058653 TaxID=3346576 RepID=UPI00364DFC05